jgi:hypothetical protein
LKVEGSLGMKCLMIRTGVVVNLCFGSSKAS